MPAARSRRKPKAPVSGDPPVSHFPDDPPDPPPLPDLPPPPPAPPAPPPDSDSLSVVFPTPGVAELVRFVATAVVELQRLATTQHQDLQRLVNTQQVVLSESLAAVSEPLQRLADAVEHLRVRDEEARLRADRIAADPSYGQCHGMSATGTRCTRDTLQAALEAGGGGRARLTVRRRSDGWPGSGSDAGGAARSRRGCRGAREWPPLPRAAGGGASPPAVLLPDDRRSAVHRRAGALRDPVVPHHAPRFGRSEHRAHRGHRPRRAVRHRDQQAAAHRIRLRCVPPGRAAPNQ